MKTSGVASFTNGETPVSERRFFVASEAVEAEAVKLSADLLHHINRVLRLKSGDEVLILDGAGGHYRCRLEELAGPEVRATILEQWDESETTLDIRLVQSLPKGEKYDLILQKGTELGISRFSPVWSERSVPQMEKKRADKKQQRWQRIVAEAARQSRRALLPTCDPPMPLDEALAGCREELKLMLWEEESLPLASRLPEKPPANAVILVGPEGGFSREEADMAIASGFLPVSLGPRILRTETAGFAVTAVLEYLYGDFGVGNNAVT